MGNLKFYAAAFAVAGLASLPLVAQNSQSPSAESPAQSAPAKLDPASIQISASQQDASTQSAGQPDAVQQSTSRAVPVTSTANSPEVSNSELRPVQGELEKKLDAKSAKVGDAVVVRTTEQAAIASGLVIPKDSKIVGHVVDAQPTGKDTQNSKVTVQFDRAQLKSGQTLPIKTVLQSVAPAMGASSGTEASGASAATPQAPGTAGTATPATGSQEPTGGSAVIPQSSRPATSGGAAVTASGSNAQAGSTAPAAGTVVAQRGDIAIKTTGIPGVLLATNAAGQPFSNAAGAILGARQNVHLDSGTRVVVAVTDAGTRATNTR